MKKIGQYEIRALLGQGSMGRVYKVVIPGIDKIAAIKCLAPTPALVRKRGMDWLKDRFVREASMISNLRHPNIVEIWHLEEWEGSLFYVMEYFCRNLGMMIGESYWADAPTRIVLTKKAVSYVVEILQGLSRLHHEGIIHQDIKPFNIMLTDTDTVKIVDFGLSKKRGETLAEDSGVFMGTRFYAAPEQTAAPDKTDHRADLFAVGVMLYRMLTGRLPGAVPEPPTVLNPDLDELWDRLILKAIEPDPDKRFQDAHEMQDDLQNVFQQYRMNRHRVCDFRKSSLSIWNNNLTMPRSEPGRVLAKHGKSTFNINDQYRPVSYFRNDIEAIDGNLLLDKTTGLIWQQSGSMHPVPWKKAWAYTETLNARKIGGFANWRLPTVNELLSLLNPPPPGEDFCFQSPFSSIQKWIWSGDTRSKRAAWAVNMDMGFVFSSDLMDFFHVRAVCSS